MNFAKIFFSIVALVLVTGTASAAENWKLDDEHTFVLFKARHMEVGNAYGRFIKMAGSFVLDREDASKCSVQVEIDAKSIFTGVQKRDAHLRSNDFFAVNQYPVIRFTSTKVEKKDEETYAITGDLEMHGVTKSMTVDFRLIGGGQVGSKRMAFESEFSVLRSDFGMRWGIDNGIVSDEIQMTIATEAVPQ